LFFIPVIPLKKVGEHVQCTTCKGKFQPGVIELPTAQQMAAALPAGMRAAATEMLRAGGQTAPARQRAIEAVRGAGQAPYGPAELDADMAQAPGTAVPALAAVGGQLKPDAREWFFAEVVRIGLANGPLIDGERARAHEIAQQLGLTPAQAHGVIAMTEQAARSS
jgi:hypothetical protein